jgi:glycosyltransferase involved in cell wall biosynthesis
VRSPKRILHVFGGMNPGGAETLVLNVYRQIDRTEVQFDFAVQAGHCHYDPEIRALGGRILRHPVPAVAGLCAYSRAFVQTLRQCGPFAGVHSHVHLFSGLVLSLSAQQQVPVRISHSHTVGDPRNLSLPRKVYRQCMRSLIWRRATHLLGCSTQACETLFGARCWSNDRVQVLPNAILLADYDDSARSGPPLREELRLLPGIPLIGHVGSFSEPKNHTFLIDVFQALCSRLPGAHLVLAGDGPLRPQIEERVRNAGLADTVHLLGIRTDIPRVMAGLDLLLLPSLWEGLPVVLVEAQAAGVPCLVSDSVTREADLHLGLIRFVGLQSGAQCWAEDCLAAMKSARPSWNQRRCALQAAGYDIRSVTDRLAGIYLV